MNCAANKFADYVNTLIIELIVHKGLKFCGNRRENKHVNSRFRILFFRKIFLQNIKIIKDKIDV